MKKGLVLVAMCTVMLFSAMSSAVAQNQDNEYKETLNKMMTLSGALFSAKTMVPQMVTMMKQQAPSVPQTFWDGFVSKWETKFADRMVELYVPIYQKYLTLEDLKQIVAFYESPVGKKLGTSTPAMTMEGMQLGQKLGMEMVTELQQELDARGNK